jgi:predicted nucleic acid-binding protein
MSRTICNFIKFPSKYFPQVLDTPVINASPIILYGRIGRLDVIERLAPRVIVPAAVIEEVQAGSQKDSTDIPIPSTVERWDLGSGESQVISFCLQGERWALLDDRMARRCISAHGLQMIGSLGMILRARKFGLIDAARPWVYKLKDEGMYVEVELIERSLSAIGEGE